MPIKETEKENYKFGYPILYSESAKQVLYPVETLKLHTEEARQLYKKTHGNFGPGEQKEREYQWPFDKNN